MSLFSRGCLALWIIAHVIQLAGQFAEILTVSGESYKQILVSINSMCFFDITTRLSDDNLVKGFLVLATCFFVSHYILYESDKNTHRWWWKNPFEYLANVLSRRCTPFQPKRKSEYKKERYRKFYRLPFYNSINGNPSQM